MTRPTGIAEESPALRTATAGDKPPGRGMRIVNWHDDRLGLAKIGTVSYTHLTLPTIYSV